MLQEINNFMNSLPAELKQAGLKPKEGLHVLLKIQEKEGTHFMDEQSVCRGTSVPRHLYRRESGASGS